jgi:hypothetical protein
MYQYGWRMIKGKKNALKIRIKKKKSLRKLAKRVETE